MDGDDDGGSGEGKKGEETDRGWVGGRGGADATVAAATIIRFIANVFQIAFNIWTEENRRPDSYAFSLH